MFFSTFSIAITSLGEKKANLSAFRTFVQFALVWICLFPIPLGIWEGLRFVTVALPGLFSYPWFSYWPFQGGSSVQIFFVHRRFHMRLLLCPYLSLISPSFGDSGNLSLVIVEFPRYFHSYCCVLSAIVYHPLVSLLCSVIVAIPGQTSSLLFATC